MISGAQPAPGFDIGILDWGIGGLGVYNHIKRIDPQRRILYISDAGFTPYGKVSSDALKKRLQDVFTFFKSRGVSRIAVACNAASTVVPKLEPWAQRQGLEIMEIIESGVSLVQGCGRHRIGIIGGFRTIRSRAHARGLKDGDFDLHCRIAQPLSALIESGDIDSDAMSLFLKHLCTPMRNIEALLLACTHYPAVEKHFRIILPDCLILDPALSMAQKACDQWSHQPGLRSPDVFLTTGDPKSMRRSASVVFGNHLPQIRQLTVPRKK